MYMHMTCTCTKSPHKVSLSRGTFGTTIKNLLLFLTFVAIPKKVEAFLLTVSVDGRINGQMDRRVNVQAEKQKQYTPR